MSVSLFMRAALDEADAAAQAGEVPVGAVIVKEGQIIAAAGNRTLRDNDPTAHAEIVAIRCAGEKLSTSRLTGCDLHVTLEPCTMCAAAISHARIARLYFGATDLKGGAILSGVRFFSANTCHHTPDVYDGIGEREASAKLRTFFANRRSPNMTVTAKE